MSDPKRDQYEYNLLVTRSKSNQRIHTDKEKSLVLQRTHYLTKYISCGKHKNAYNLCDDCIVFPAKDNYQMDDYQLEKNCLCT